jgi:hypothetical protein
MPILAKFVMIIKNANFGEIYNGKKRKGEI